MFNSCELGEGSNCLLTDVANLLSPSHFAVHSDAQVYDVVCFSGREPWIDSSDDMLPAVLFSWWCEPKVIVWVLGALIVRLFDAIHACSMSRSC